MNSAINDTVPYNRINTIQWNTLQLHFPARGELIQDNDDDDINDDGKGNAIYIHSAYSHLK